MPETEKVPFSPTAKSVIKMNGKPKERILAYYIQKMPLNTNREVSVTGGNLAYFGSRVRKLKLKNNRLMLWPGYVRGLQRIKKEEINAL